MKHSENCYSGCLYFSSNVLARQIGKMADDAFSPLGLSPSYAFLLMLANAKPGIQPKELSAQLQLTPSTVTRLLEKLEYKGLVERMNAGKNTQVYPTKQSEEMEDDLQLAWKRLSENYQLYLGPKIAEELTGKVNVAIAMLEK